MNELKLFRPSWGPGVEKCGHYVASVSTSPNAFRGKRFHETMADLWRKKYTVDEVPRDLWEPVDYAYGELEPLFATAEKIGIEETLPLYDEFEEYVTEGTIDLWGSWTKPNPITVLVDYKTGEERDYWAQLWIYALILCDRLGIDEIQLILIFADQKRTLNMTVSREQLEERVWQIVENKTDPRAPFVINRYCDYCDLRQRCPAWDEERKLAVPPVAELDVDVARELLMAPSFDVILANPDLLGRFIIAYKHLRTLVEKVWEIEKRAIIQIEQGTKIPGIIKIDNPGVENVDAQAFFELVRSYTDRDRLLEIVKTIDNAKAGEILDRLKSEKPKIFEKAKLPVKRTASSSYLKASGSG